jgi:hypothetical protein
MRLLWREDTFETPTCRIFPCQIHLIGSIQSRCNAIHHRRICSVNVITTCFKVQIQMTSHSCHLSYTHVKKNKKRKDINKQLKFNTWHNFSYGRDETDNNNHNDNEIMAMITRSNRTQNEKRNLLSSDKNKLFYLVWNEHGIHQSYNSYKECDRYQKKDIQQVRL